MTEAEDKDSKANGQNSGEGEQAEAQENPPPATGPDDGNGPEQQGETQGAEGESESEARKIQELINELEDACLRAKAETENVRKRMEEKMERASAFAVKSFARSLLDVHDALTAALSNKDAEKQNLLEGVELTLKKLDAALLQEQIKEIEALNKRFDPELHDAMGTRETAEAEPETVCEVMVSGFTIAGTVLRPASVIVAREPKGADKKEADAKGEESGGG